MNQKSIMPRQLVLAGDIGGTKTNLAVFSLRGEKLHAESQASFPSKQYSGLTPILKEFCGNQRTVEAACFGIAGPVVDGRVKTTNLPWIVDTDELRRTLKLDAVQFAQRSRSRRLRSVHAGRR